ncbi:uncharacterized protein LOC126992005 [Eriocheir sinensis]|uniref:uncharacterized protein LOC126992005 n=1 Tax=Eriocheir sinensis TaxID=95602 RepID=UPI0021C8214B|nr:uncharacterized protein LOC126992005 [Eriocheir sinensis]
MALDISQSLRGGELLVHHGFEYILQTKEPWMDAEKKYWRCRKYKTFKCKSSIITKGSNIIKEPSDHTHSGDSIQTDVHVALAKMKQDAKNTRATTRTILADHLVPLNDDVLARMPVKSAIERRIRRTRQKEENIQPPPQSRNFEIPNDYADIVMYDSGVDDPQRMLAFGRHDLVNCLQSELWIGDGTFETTPLIFFQLYTIHAKIGNSYPPCIYFLLPNKTAETYTRMIEILKMLHPGLNPSTILLDFELAAINAFKNEFPLARVSGCFFHLNQSVIRKVNELGLKVRYETDRDFAMTVKSLPALAFVPIDEVPEVFEELGAAFPDEAECNDLIAYFESTYVRGPRVGGRARNPRFEPQLWNHYEDAQICAPKTTNCTEGFHNSLKSLFMCSHPTMWSFMNGIRKDIAVHRLTMQNAQAVNLERPRNRYVLLANRLAVKVRSYGEEADKLRYLRAIAHMQVVG